MASRSANDSRAGTIGAVFRLVTARAASDLIPAQDDLALAVGAEAAVELLDGRGEGEGGVAQAAPGRRGGAGRQFLLEQPLEEVGVAQLLVGRTREPRREDRRRLGELDLREEGGKSGAHDATSGRAMSTRTSAS